MHLARLERRDETPPLINEKVLRGISTLPVLPAVWQRLLTCLEDPWSSLGEMEALIRQEQGLSARVLSQANSSFYGFSGRVTNVKMALQVLGLQEARRLCLGDGIGQLMRASRLYRQAEGQMLWRHALLTAEAAALLAREVGRGDGETAFAAGLLHDLGKVLLAACFPLAYQSVRQIQQREGLTWREAEDRLNLDHQSMGLFLAQRWGLPPLLAEVIGRHHQPQGQLEHGPTVALVHLADALVLALDQPQPGPPSPAGGAAWEHGLQVLGLGPAALEACRQGLKQRLEMLPPM
ncbi:MAG: HDOD domain-containing protein [Desulfarculus sp.]|nr:HDOD domain-containing protein [Desulfarculus sp.]